MKTWKHMSEDNRKTICSCISHNKKLIEINKIINYDPRAFSKEVFITFTKLLKYQLLQVSIIYLFN